MATAKRVVIRYESSTTYGIGTGLPRLGISLRLAKSLGSILCPLTRRSPYWSRRRRYAPPCNGVQAPEGTRSGIVPVASLPRRPGPSSPEARKKVMALVVRGMSTSCYRVLPRHCVINGLSVNRARTQTPLTGRENRRGTGGVSPVYRKTPVTWQLQPRRFRR